jgi:hypothetical protein
VAWEIGFTHDQTTFRRVDMAGVPDLAGRMTVRQRMAYALRGGSMAAEDLAAEIGAELDTVRRTAGRYKDSFTVLPGGKLGLAERRS